MSSFFVVVVYCYMMMKFYLFSSEKMFLIKWLLSWKSLKQLFIIWLISCFTLSVGSFVSATAYVYQNNTESVNQKTAWYTLNVFWKWNLLSKSWWYSKSMLFSSNYYYFFRTSSWVPYIHDYTHYWLSKWYYLCNWLRSSSCLSFPCSISDINMNWCSNNQMWSDWVNIISSFMSSIASDDTYLLNERSWELYVCFDNTSLNSNICFSSTYVDHSTVDNYWSQFTDINSNLLSNSPWYNWWNSWWWSSWWWIQIWNALSSTWWAIDFYEQRMWLNKDVCYVWVNNMSTLYWTAWVSFNQWWGLTIFDAFQTLYWSSDPDEVYVWINNWLLNYEQRFWNDWNPMYLSNYNSWTNQVDIYYENLTFPFANNPVAVYFMASYIEQVFTNWLYDPSWSAVVSYCNMKINNWTFDEIIDESDKWIINNFIEKSNQYKWLNSDWTEKDYWAWLSSWVELAFSWDTSLKNSLKEFLDEAEDNISSLKDISNSITWHILPVWIITPFVFFALFRFIRKH